MLAGSLVSWRVSPLWPMRGDRERESNAVNVADGSGGGQHFF